MTKDDDGKHMRVLLAIFVILMLAEGGKMQAREVCSTVSLMSHKPNPVYFKFFKKQNQRKKVIASALAFPFPFGMLGLHRIYLGTQPYVPLVYVGTLGGCAGILPMIDFCTLVGNKDISRYQTNSRIFMWVDNEIKK